MYLSAQLRAIIISFLVCIAAPTKADTLATPVEVRRVTDDAMDSIGQGEYENGLKKIKPLFGAAPPETIDEFPAEVTRQFKKLQRHGHASGYEFIREERIGESLMRLTYLAKLETSATCWIFTFYKGKTGWVLNKLKFDDDLNIAFRVPG